MQHYFTIPMPGTVHTRYCLLSGDHTVTGIQVSRPDGVEVPKPANVRWRPRDLEQQLAQMRVWTVPAWNERGPLNPTKHNGEQPRTTWRRAGKQGAA